MILITLVCLIVLALSLGLIYRDVVSAAMSYSTELEAAQLEGAILTDAEFEKLFVVDHLKGPKFAFSTSSGDPRAQKPGRAPIRSGRVTG
ncbi:MAG TPA: hypothetical protein PLO61_10200 [Fimbriimonadaceae bacterium]|nr:hypothetical protein [Fimbriimonadaceae bacterium]HRJ33987.1 hypothetical protein [Fimbriimonadaceae bacterium]